MCIITKRSYFSIVDRFLRYRKNRHGTQAFIRKFEHPARLNIPGGTYKMLVISVYTRILYQLTSFYFSGACRWKTYKYFEIHALERKREDACFNVFTRQQWVDKGSISGSSAIYVLKRTKLTAMLIQQNSPRYHALFFGHRKGIQK